ncbi:MAG: hypothetical protein QOG10_6567 [Kribbellaceae bacterium]|jgi:hypothetical protein|nr:hypothetical protein [Kribbellaceae bacterium]
MHTLGSAMAVLGAVLLITKRRCGVPCQLARMVACSSEKVLIYGALRIVFPARSEPESTTPLC